MCLGFFSSRRRHTRFDCDWSSDVCSSDLTERLRLSGMWRYGTPAPWASPPTPLFPPLDPSLLPPARKELGPFAAATLHSQASSSGRRSYRKGLSRHRAHRGRLLGKGKNRL